MIKSFICLFLVMLISFSAINNQAEAGENSKMKIRLILGSEELKATLEDSKISRDFVSMLPLTFSMKDFAGKEKISKRLPKSLNTDGAQPGYAPSAGDIAYYAPWGNLALFYGNNVYAPGLVRLGHFDGDIKTLEAMSGDFELKIVRDN